MTQKTIPRKIDYFLQQGNYVLGSICLSISLFVCLLATLLKTLWTDCDDIFGGVYDGKKVI